jgi:hypothetical protein
MDFVAMAQFLVLKFPVLGMVFALLGLLVVAGQALVLITPSTADDAAWEKIKAMPVIGQIISAVIAFAPIQKK